ncbi:MAG: ABC transporter permease, partial [Roseivirga sp.]|nr:ABC transporter permease [Roseivirga sp.]
MLKNYFKVAFRTLWKNKGYAFINIIGLAIGISGATLFLTFVKDELSFDKMHTNYDRIVRPITIQTNVEPSRHYGANPMVLATTMEEQLPEVENQVTLYRYGNQINYTIDGQNYSDRDFFFSTPELLEVFDFELVRGDEETALVEPKSVIISESKAMALFGSLDALGEVIQTQGGDVKVTGILKDIPDNSHLFADMFFSELLPPQLMETIRSWTAFEFSSSYLLLSPDADLE